MYPTLVIEMRRKNITQKTMAAELNISQKAFSNKMSGKTDWTLGECRKAADFLKHPSIDELFKYECREA